MTATESILLRRIYDLERQRDERTYADDHLFEEWVEWYAEQCGASRRY